MKTSKLIFAILWLRVLCFSQEKATTYKPLTLKYAGTYSYGTDVEKSKVGSIIIYPETDSTIQFYIDLNRGAPSYNMGVSWGRIILVKDSGIYFSKNDYDDEDCKWSIHFEKKTLTIKTLDEKYNCGFGGGVYVDGIFTRTSNKVSTYYDDQEGRRVYFKDLINEK